MLLYILYYTRIKCIRPSCRFSFLSTSFLVRLFISISSWKTASNPSDTYDYMGLCLIDGHGSSNSPRRINDFIFAHSRRNQAIASKYQLFICFSYIFVDFRSIYVVRYGISAFIPSCFRTVYLLPIIKQHVSS